jgi:murein DD-endopeptidase MepM/ murein hydrolase activator NlpD
MLFFCPLLVGTLPIMATGVFTTYSHLSRADVTVGQVVHEGDRIGAIGSSGRSQEPHLHFELAVGGLAVDPVLWLTNVLPGGLNAVAAYLAANDEYASLWNMERAR